MSWRVNIIKNDLNISKKCIVNIKQKEIYFFELINYSGHDEQYDRFWGYRFDGNGGYKNLEGKIVMEESE